MLEHKQRDVVDSRNVERIVISDGCVSVALKSESCMKITTLGTMLNKSELLHFVHGPHMTIIHKYNHQLFTIKQ